MQTFSKQTALFDHDVVSNHPLRISRRWPHMVPHYLPLGRVQTETKGFLLLTVEDRGESPGVEAIPVRE